ncbi:molybdopterin-guanine dinucleotide biosynthesis protein MobB [Edaphovirga cremea]|uniref:molybdopterin-guanine dinucleotide biosynthesis protein MobB n=1 Tax=Edaphovirga cremea TaxID=2267246 RepID=UPI000DEF96D2|nr:molybdopterin-guanine dinucleotide biosynthesis protein MobB [Edaphovirga cremea]
MKKLPLPLLGIVAYSGTGKTTLLKMLIPLLRQHDIRVGLIKHSHHDMDVDTPGKDSYELRKAGADQTMVASDRRWALMTERQGKGSVELGYLASRFEHSSLDMIFVEGFKHEPIAKIALFRPEVGKPLAGLIDEYVVAIASNEQISETSLPILDINDAGSIAQFIVQWLKKQY